MTTLFKAIAFAGLTALSVTACASPSQAPKAAHSAAHTDENVTAKGHFSGDSDHVVTGTAKVSWKGGHWVVTLSDDFSLDGAPAPVVALGNGKFVKAATLGKLEHLTGSQSFILPAGLDIGDYNQVYIWCTKFSIPLGHANLELI